MEVVQMNKVTRYKGNYKPSNITAITVKDNNKNVVELYNENGEMFQWLMVWNKDINVESEVIKHYDIKYVAMDVLKAISNKYNVTNRIDSYDVDHIRAILSNWIVKPTIMKEFEYIEKDLKNGAVMGAYNRLMNIKVCIDNSIPCTDDKGFYLLEKY